MTMKNIENWMLHAYVDDELDAVDRKAIEELLDTDPAAREALASYRSQNEALRRAFTGTLEEPVPPQLVESIRRGGVSKRWVISQTAAAIIFVMIGGATGFFLGREPLVSRAPTLADEALVAHEIYSAEVRHPVEVAANDRQHLQTWLSNRVGVAFTVPDLSDDGYSLLGGRLVAAGDRPAAQLMYEDASKRRITIFLTSNPTKSEAALRVEHQGKFIACYWMEGSLEFAVAGELDEAPMMKLARDIYGKFET
jgi:anti-sigma factor RsiW